MTAPLVGREHELGVLGDVLTGLGRGSGASLVVSGEPGIGKTRLLHAAAELAARKGISVTWSRTWPDVGTPALWPWVQVLRSLAADLAGGEPNASLGAGDHPFQNLGRREPGMAGSGTQRLLSLVPELGAVLADRDGHDRPDGGGRTGEHASFYLREAMATLVLAAARHRPQVVLLDDLHWADIDSLRLAERLAGSAQGASLCLLAAVRDGTTSGEPGQALARLRATSHELALDGLTPQQCRHLAQARTEALFERTGGNPLFLEGVLQSGQEDVPGAVAEPARSVLIERLESLGPRERALLEIASVAQHPPIPRPRPGDAHANSTQQAPNLNLSPELVARVARADRATETAATEGASPKAAAETLTSLVETGLLQHHPGGAVAFRHGLVAEVAYLQLDPRRRAGLHQLWAEALIEGWPPAGEQPEVIARHLLTAPPYVEPVEAHRWATRAAEVAAERCSYDDATGWYETALDTLPPMAHARHDEILERCDLLLALGQVQLRSRGTIRAMAAFREAVAAAGQARDDERRLNALVWLTEARFRAHGARPDETTGVALLNAIEASPLEVQRIGPTKDAAPPVPPVLRARAAEQLARLEVVGGPSDRAKATAQGAPSGGHEIGATSAAVIARQALRLAQKRGDSDAVVAARRALRWAQAGPANARDDRQRASYELAGALSRRSSPADWWAAHSWFLVDALERSDRPLVDAELSSCRRLADQLQQPYLTMRTSTWDGTVALLEGNLDGAEQAIAQGLAIAEHSGLATAALLGQRAYLASARGEPDVSIDLLGDAAGALPPSTALHRAMLASFYADAGRAVEATFELERLAADGFGHVPRDVNWLAALVWCATACVELHRPDVADILRRLLVPFRGHGVVAGGLPHLFLGAVCHHTGALAVTAGDPEAALDDLADALALHERLRARPWVDRTLAEQRRAQRPAGRPSPTRPMLAREGDGWKVAFTGPAFHLRDSKGLRGLSHLLARPGVAVPVTALVAQVLGDPVANPERARVNVTRQLRAALDRIGKHDPDLGTHLRSAVTTGRDCCYRPAGPAPSWHLDPTDDPRWQAATISDTSLQERCKI